MGLRLRFSPVSLAVDQMGANALEVLQARYLRKINGQQESPREMAERVALAVAAAEKPVLRQDFAEKFFRLIESLRFLPNSPTLMNAGSENGQLSACFVLPIEDSLDSVFTTLKNAALIHQSGGGTGFSFSRLRPQGSLVKSSQGRASGPVSFLRVFDAATEAIKQGGTRRGANMGVLRIDHPDVLEFIQLKQDLKSTTNFNVSVGVTDAFMEAAITGGPFDLKDPATGLSVRTLKADELLLQIVKAAWMTGDPGIVFLDRMNQFNPTPDRGAFESTNPCGEQPLLAFESCNLGSLDIAKYYVGGAALLDWELLRSDIYIAVRFLDDVIDINTYPVPECGVATRETRKIGLGFMGFADLLLRAGVRYGSQESLSLAEKIMAFLSREARQASHQLAKEKGPFPAFFESFWGQLGFPVLRNATVTTLAPTGTISIIAGCSSGIEPVFAPVIVRNILDGKRFVEPHPVIARLVFEKLGNREWVHYSPKDQDDFLKGCFGDAWVKAEGVTPSEHVTVQAAFQRHSDSAVSKTVNLSRDATPEAVLDVFLEAYRSGCKGVTVFRDQSRGGVQVLEGGVVPQVGALCEKDCPEC